MRLYVNVCISVARVTKRAIIIYYNISGHTLTPIYGTYTSACAFKIDCYEMLTQEKGAALGGIFNPHAVPTYM